ncbi:hypothetical protein V493_08323 [Pseudogymnoascus sp. VKM F-4281 (FW-2241)]|nr:hypothetical protein V493_08323 [Pseudogymnoascus sp. VKM F-4281 (FW-2241)]
MHEAASSAETLEELPEEANEYTPSQAAPPEMIAAARARALAANAARQEEGRAAAEAEATARREEELVAEVTALRKEEREVEAAAVAVAIAAEAEEEATGTAAPMEKPERISDADKARAAVENEPHSPSWNGSTYIDGREHHYCGPDFPCQMDTQCDPSIRELWDRGYPVAPDAPPKRSALGGPMRSLFGMRKRPEQPEQKYTPVSVECIRVGNSATTIFSKATEPVILEDSTNEGARENGGAREGCRTMRGLRKFWGFWSNPGSKMGSRRGVIVTKSEDSLVVAERLGDRQLMDEPTESMASATATAAKNLAAAACYPVGESTVETAQPIQRVDSGTEMADGIEIVNPETSANK